MINVLLSWVTALAGNTPLAPKLNTDIIDVPYLTAEIATGSTQAMAFRSINVVYCSFTLIFYKGSSSSDEGQGNAVGSKVHLSRAGNVVEQVVNRSLSCKVQCNTTQRPPVSTVQHMLKTETE